MSDRYGLLREDRRSDGTGTDCIEKVFHSAPFARRRHEGVARAVSKHLEDSECRYWQVLSLSESLAYQIRSSRLLTQSHNQAAPQPSAQPYSFIIYQLWLIVVIWSGREIKLTPKPQVIVRPTSLPTSLIPIAITVNAKDRIARIPEPSWEM